ncbi:hypothetical protein D9M70_444660 [compost metagenome]
MGQDAGGFASGLQTADDVQKVGVVTLLCRRHAPTETLVAVILQRKAGAPSLVGKRRIRDYIVVGTQAFTILELGRRQRVAGEDVRGGEAVQNHVHPRQTGGSDILLLTFQGDVLASFGGDLE